MPAKLSILLQIPSASSITKAITALTNASGGLLIVGIEVDDKTKIPEKINRLKIKDNETTLDNYINLIQPKCTDYRIKLIFDSNDSTIGVFIIEIKKGLRGPYMASDKRYYIRREKKSEPMNNQEDRE